MRRRRNARPTPAPHGAARRHADTPRLEQPTAAPARAERRRDAPTAPGRTCPRAALAFACCLLLLAHAGCRRSQPADSGANAANAAASASPAPSAATLCGVPYYPVREGLEKQYRVTYSTRGLPPSAYTESYADIKADSFTLRYAFPDLKVDTGWNCTPEGMVALEYGKLDFARQQNANFKLETVGREGVTVPAAARWRVGEAWASRYEIKSTITTGAGDAEPGVGAGTIEITNRVVGEESVTVPAGEFRALKVESGLKMRMTVRVGKQSMPTSMDMKNVSWFAEGVGMVKSESAGDFAGATTELTGLKR